MCIRLSEEPDAPSATTRCTLPRSLPPLRGEAPVPSSAGGVGSDSSGSGERNEIDACSLITDAEATAVLGETFDRGRSSRVATTRDARRSRLDDRGRACSMSGVTNHVAP